MPSPQAAAPLADDERWDDWLGEALEPGRLQPYYQPIVDVRRGVVVGYEALARFPGFPVADPESWFGAARARGFASALEAAALGAALSRRDQLPRNTFLSVNVGPDVLDEPQVRAVLDDQSDLRGVVVELTEQAEVDAGGALVGSLDALRARGAMIAIDDVGAGFSGLRQILAVRPAFIKLDRSLVADVDQDEAKRALVEMVGVLAGRLDAWLLAEGVERAGELHALARLQVPLVQGYHLGRPAPGWADLPRLTAARLAALAGERTGPRLRTLLEHVEVAPSADGAAALLAYDGVEVVVVLDADARPAMTLERDGRTRTGGALLRISVEASVATAARRAIARPRTERFDPLLCTDDAGRYVGLVRMERVIEALSAVAG